MSERKWPGQRAGWCIHYRASPAFHMKDKPWICGAGVDIDEAWAGVSHSKQPCFLDDRGNSKPDAVPCAQLRRPTPEEIAEYEAWRTGRMEKLTTVLRGIADWRATHKGNSHYEIVECPACKGRLHLSITACNGHVHGQCETPDCVAWME
jgi:hypothetical protein